MRGFSVSIHRVQRHNHWGQSHRGKIITIGRLVSARVLHRYPCRHSTLSLSFSLSLSSPLPPPCCLAPWADSKPLSHPYPGTTSHIRGSTILYKILAVVILGALYYYFFITMWHTASKVRTCMLRERLDQRTTILTTYYSLFFLSLSLSSYRCTRPFRTMYIRFRSNRHARDIRIIGYLCVV